MKKLLCIISSFLILWSMLLHAEMHIRITHGTNLIRPIGIGPFQRIGSNTNVPEDIGSIIAADLRNTGKFNPVDLSASKLNILRRVHPTTTWSLAGIDMFVVGQIKSNADGNYNITYQLIDANVNKSKNNIIMRNSYRVNKKLLRYAGHAISDEIFEKLTGIKGAFSTRIVYVVKTNKKHFPYELRISDYDGYNQFVVNRSQQPLMSPTWSPDGTKLAYVTFETGHSSLVIQTLANGSIYQVASFPRHNGAPAFSPDGKKLAFALSKSGSLNLYVMDLISNKIYQVTNNISNNTEPAWFPDSQNLIFTSDEVGRPQLFKLNINSGHIIHRITWEGIQNQDADVSSDGKFIVMVSLIEGQQHITKQDLATGSLQVLSSTFLDETPSLAPNDTMVIYSSSKGIGSVLNLVSTNGLFKTSFSIADGNIKFPSWSPYLNKIF